MLSEEIQEKMAEVLVDRIEELNTTIIEEIGRAIKQIGTLSPSQAYKLAQSLKYGASSKKIVKKIAEITNLNQKDVKKILSQVAKTNLEFSKPYFEYRGIDFVPYSENEALKRQVDAIARLTNDRYTNFMSTSAFKMTVGGKEVMTPLSKIYQKTLDRAVLAVSQGKESYQSAMRKVMRELTDNGIRQVDYESGYSRRLDSAVRMNMLDGMRQLSNEMQQELGEQFDANGVEISVHENPAPDHEDIQGLQYSKEDFEKLNESLDRPISTMNCYHYIFSIILGVNKPQYSKEQLAAMKKRNHKGFTFEGKHYTMYEGTQLQRSIETKIRSLKDRAIGARARGDKDDFSYCKQNIRMLTDKYNNLSQVSGLPTKKQRLSVSGYINRMKDEETIQYLGINIEKNSDLYKKIIDNKLVYHSTNNLKEIWESDYITGNLAVQNKDTTLTNYGYEAAFLKPESLNYSTKLYNGDRGNNTTGLKAEGLRTTDINEFVDLAGVNHRHSTAVVEKMPFFENLEAIRTYSTSPNYKFWQEISKKYKIPLIEYELNGVPSIIKKPINFSNKK